MRKCGLQLILAGLWLAMGWPTTEAAAQAVDHPVITEIYTEPPGLGGPLGRDPQDLHQEFLEIYLPPLGDLAAGLNPDSLALTIYDVEGDASSPGLAQVNYRIDLPVFDLNPSNGLTGLARPTSGLVVLGWVDYVGNPATGLAGTPSTRVALIDGGVTSTTGFTFIAINGAQFGGTTNFPVPVAVSFIDTVIDPVLGKVEQGSGAVLLVDRSDPGYVEYCGQNDPASCPTLPNLAAGTGLGVSSLLDGIAPNDDSNFEVLAQPYAAPTGDNIDLEFVLPLGGAFSLLVPQVPEEADGYQRLFLDFLKTSEDGSGSPDPVTDALDTYRAVATLGPFSPTPGRAPSTTSAAALSVADRALQQIEVLTNTSARPGLLAANVGGDFGLSTVTTPGAPSNPGAMTIQSDASSFPAIGQAEIHPAVGVSTFATTPPGHVEVIAVQVDATRASPADPLLVDATAVVNVTFTAIDPTRGQNAAGQPFQATAFLAVQGLPDDPQVANELVATSLGQRMAAGLGTSVFDSRGNGALLINPSTNLSNPGLIEPLVASMPDDPADYINDVGTTGTLVQKVLSSAEATLTTTYDDNFNGSGTLVKARAFSISETATSGSGFSPTERVHYADARGVPGDPASGLTDVLTGRDFELALIETSLGPLGFVEDGSTDDFGLVVEIGATRPGASVLPGEFVMLSFTGGLEGADIDTLDVPPHSNLTNIIYVDLDPLDMVLGAESITKVFVIDGSGNGDIDVLDVITVPEPGLITSALAAIAALAWSRRRSQAHLRARSHGLATDEQFV